LQSLRTDARAWRHDIHKHPELGFQENRTAGLIADLLAEFGLEVHAGIGTTGVVGVLRRGAADQAIGLRADIDALPIQEANTFEHRSVHDGVFHGCGHDGHTAMLLAAARQLAESGEFAGTVYFIFQPSEEDGRGALAMIDDGLFERFEMKAVYGMHNMPGIPAGHFAVKKGAIMTSEDIFVITINGRGGHASMPDRAIDPLVIAAEVVLRVTYRWCAQRHTIDRDDQGRLPRNVDDDAGNDRETDAGDRCRHYGCPRGRRDGRVSK
jgi:hippurate hydrolase